MWHNVRDVWNRTGKRTTAGLVRDGVNSAVRYILNNFYDGFRQVTLTSALELCLTSV